MGVVMLEDIKKIVEDFKKSKPDGSLYLIISKEFIDGIEKWLHEYVYTLEGKWLDYVIKESANETELYILHLYSKWLIQTEVMEFFLTKP